jgi:hypothetical protein
MADRDPDRQQEARNPKPANPREHVREMGEYLRRMGERLRQLDEELSHLEAQDDEAVDSGRGWPTGG